MSDANPTTLPTQGKSFLEVPTDETGYADLVEDIIPSIFEELALDIGETFTSEQLVRMSPDVMAYADLYRVHSMAELSLYTLNLLKKVALESRGFFASRSRIIDVNDPASVQSLNDSTKQAKQDQRWIFDRIRNFKDNCYARYSKTGEMLDIAMLIFLFDSSVEMLGGGLGRTNRVQSSPVSIDYSMLGGAMLQYLHAKAVEAGVDIGGTS